MNNPVTFGENRDQRHPDVRLSQEPPEMTARLSATGSCWLTSSVHVIRSSVVLRAHLDKPMQKDRSESPAWTDEALRPSCLARLRSKRRALRIFSRFRHQTEAERHPPAQGSCLPSNDPQ